MPTSSYVGLPDIVERNRLRASFTRLPWLGGNGSWLSDLSLRSFLADLERVAFSSTHEDLYRLLRYYLCEYSGDAWTLSLTSVKMGVDASAKYVVGIIKLFMVGSDLSAHEFDTLQHLNRMCKSKRTSIRELALTHGCRILAEELYTKRTTLVLSAVVKDMPRSEPTRASPRRPGVIGATTARVRVVSGSLVPVSPSTPRPVVDTTPVSPSVMIPDYRLNSVAIKKLSEDQRAVLLTLTALAVEVLPHQSWLRIGKRKHVVAKLHDHLGFGVQRTTKILHELKRGGWIMMGPLTWEPLSLHCSAVEAIRARLKW